MAETMRMQRWGDITAKAVVAVLALIALAACATTAPPPPETTSSAPPPDEAPSPPAAPPVALAGRWRFTAAAGGGCFMTLGDAPGASQGPVAPEGGCPGNFFTSRKWTFEHDMLVIRDHKGQQLAQLAFTGGHFEGKDNNGGTLTLSR